MCILFIYIDPEPQENSYRLVVASNRDEFYRRPTQLLSQDEHVVGGKDLENKRAGGMWLGLSLKQTNHSRLRFGALLNVTGEERKESKGRGFIVPDYLRGDAKAEEYIDDLLNSEEPFNAFNFVAVEISAKGETVAHHCGNIPPCRNDYCGRRFLGFGNTIPAAQLTKVTVGTRCFEDIVNKYGDLAHRQELIDELLALLKNEKKQLPDEALQKRQPNVYEQLSCIFVKIVAAGYGTRTHSILLVDFNWNVEFHEVSMAEPIDPEVPVWKTNVVKARL